MEVVVVVLTLIRPFRDSSKKRWNDVIFVLYDKRLVISCVLPPFPALTEGVFGCGRAGFWWWTDGRTGRSSHKRIVLLFCFAEY